MNNDEIYNLWEMFINDEKYYNDNNKEVYHCSWINILKKSQKNLYIENSAYFFKIAAHTDYPYVVCNISINQ